MKNNIDNFESFFERNGFQKKRYGNADFYVHEDHTGMFGNNSWNDVVKFNFGYQGVTGALTYFSKNLQTVDEIKTVCKVLWGEDFV